MMLGLDLINVVQTIQREEVLKKIYGVSQTCGDIEAKQTRPDMASEVSTRPEATWKGPDAVCKGEMPAM